MCFLAGLTPDGKTLTGSTAYSPFGQKTASTGSNPALGYQSGWTDPVSGDVNMAARWYAPGSGSFDSRDTWQLPADSSAQTNRYLYGNGSPLNGTDPNGHCLGPVIVLCGAAVGEAIGWGTLGTVVGLGGGAVGWEWWHSDSGTSSYTGSYSSALTYDYAGSSASSLSGQAARFRYTGGLMEVGVTTYPDSDTPWKGKKRVRDQRVRKKVKPKRKVEEIDQNPNNGAHPKPGPPRPPAKIDWDPKNGGWQPGDGWKLLYTASNILNFFGNGQYSPDTFSSLAPSAGRGPSGGTGSGQPDDCRSQRRTGVWYGATDSAHGNRATGAEACLDDAYLKANKGSAANPDKSPGYRWAQDLADDWGYKPKQWVNACHLIARELTGSGSAPGNLSTCARPANVVVRGNSRIDQNFRYYEKQVKAAVNSGQVVDYSVTPHYQGPRTVPDSWTFNATAWGPDGSRHRLFTGEDVSNDMAPGGQYNLGRQVDGNGLPIPTGATK
ncbi:RHS repeat-associated core domain-containing protein [Streptomyces sp. NPDC051994]|uniref:RHS repeat-associated core domain-containing protein n=1 Tax=unclassified Streptomyces TaxID=2593676 RepID=UPI0034120068